MTPGHAGVMGLLIQADFDGELDTLPAAELARHVADCEECQVLAKQLKALQMGLRRGVARYQAPAELRDRIRQQVMEREALLPTVRKRRRITLPVLAGFLAGAAVAAALVLAIVPRALPESTRVAREIASATERSRQPGHLLDVESTRSAVIAAWVREHAGFAVPVPTLPDFTLIGGRLDYLHERLVAVLTYRQNGDVFELYAWPERHTPTPPTRLETAGITLEYWRAGGIEYWAAGSSAAPLAAFASAWRKSI